MKRLVILMTLGWIWMGCGNGATDQDAKTDTTSMPVDSNLYKDSSDHINRANGTVPLDSLQSGDSVRK